MEWERHGPRWQEAESKLTGTATGFANLKKLWTESLNLTGLSED
jgi:hypothetical protein